MERCGWPLKHSRHCERVHTYAMQYSRMPRVATHAMIYRTVWACMGHPCCPVRKTTVGGITIIVFCIFHSNESSQTYIRVGLWAASGRVEPGLQASGPGTGWRARPTVTIRALSELALHCVPKKCDACPCHCSTVAMNPGNNGIARFTAWRHLKLQECGICAA